MQPTEPTTEQLLAISFQVAVTRLAEARGISPDIARQQCIQSAKEMASHALPVQTECITSQVMAFFRRF